MMGDLNGDEGESDRARRLCFILTQLRDDLAQIVIGADARRGGGRVGVGTLASIATSAASTGTFTSIGTSTSTVTSTGLSPPQSGRRRGGRRAVDITAASIMGTFGVTGTAVVGPMASARVGG